MFIPYDYRKKLKKNEKKRKINNDDNKEKEPQSSQLLLYFENKLDIQEQAYDIGLTTVQNEQMMSTLEKKLFKSEQLFEECVAGKKQRIQQKKQYHHDYYAKKKEVNGME